jgi:uracil-DNA glycosylase
MFFEQMHPTWQLWLEPVKPLLSSIEARVLAEENFLPAANQVMRAFEGDPKVIKVVLVGQDPYPTPGDAIGLAFAMSKERTIPRSLRNIAKELESDVGVIPKNPAHMDLEQWANQGVLLLNRSLTTRANEAGSHSKLGWDEFTLAAVSALANQQKFVLLAWGKPAQKLGKALGLEHDIVVIESAHPSPLSASRGFLGSKPFNRTNQALSALGLEHIDWSC